MEEEKLIKSETFYEGKLFNLRKDTVMLEGRTLTREIIEHNGAVAVIPVDEDGNVIMVRQFRSGARLEMLELPAGGIDDGEDPIQTAQRELQEEIGYYPEELIRVGGYWVAAGYNTEYITIYLCRKLRPSSMDTDTGEVIEITRMPVKEALAKARSGEFEDAKTVVGLLWAERYLTE